MLANGIPFGHDATHSPVLVQPPKPSSSIAATMSSTRRSRSGCPCGNTLRWLTLAEVNSIADPLGQAATQAPQPMQVALSKATSASDLGTGVACASGALPGGA